jgi:hypothetical protein
MKSMAFNRLKESNLKLSLLHEKAEDEIDKCHE